MTAKLDNEQLIGMLNAALATEREEPLEHFCDEVEDRLEKGETSPDLIVAALDALKVIFQRKMDAHGPFAA